MNEQEKNQLIRSRRMIIIAAVIVIGFALCLGVYFGIFVSLRVYGGG